MQESSYSNTFFKGFKSFLRISEPKEYLKMKGRVEVKISAGIWTGLTSSHLFCASASDAKKSAVSTAFAMNVCSSDISF